MNRHTPQQPQERLASLLPEVPALRRARILLARAGVVDTVHFSVSQEIARRRCVERSR